MKKSKKQQRIDELRRSDVAAQIVGRDDIEYGEHTELPKGENVALMGRGLGDALEVQQRMNETQNLLMDHMERSSVLSERDRKFAEGEAEGDKTR